MPNQVKLPLIIFVVVVAVFILWFGAHSARKIEMKRYAMTGSIVSVHPDRGTATVHNDNIPGFMQPMDMEYKLADPALLSRLKPGDRIRATLASDQQNTWQLENVTVTAPAPLR